MIRFILLTICCGLISVVTQAQTYRTANTTITFSDPARNGGFGSGGGPGRQIQTEIYYPSLVGGANAAVAPGSFPVIVFGHGFVMGWDAYAPFYDSLSKLGYIVALPRTEGSAIPFPVHTDFAKDLAIVASRITALNTAPSSPFYQRISNKLAVGGHSMGGGCTYLADQYTSLPTCYFSFAAAETNPSAIAAAPNISKPHLVIGGSMDCVAGPAGNQDPMYNALGSACKTKVIIDRAYHCQFNANNTTCALGEATCLPSGGLSRQDQLNKVFSLIIPYLNYFLKAQCNAWTSFQQATTASGMVSTSNCVQRIPNLLSISGDSVLCNGNPGLIQVADTGFQYRWNDGIIINPRGVNIAGNYVVQVSNAYCTATSDTFDVQDLNGPPPAVLLSAPTVVCSGNTQDTFAVQSDASVTSYQWQVSSGWTILSGAADTLAVIQHNGTSGTATLSGTNWCGTSSVAVFNLQLDSVPGFTAPLLIPDSVICVGQGGITLQAFPTPNVTGLFWSLPAGWNINLTQFTAPVIQAGNSSGLASVHAINGCGSSDTIFFNLSVFPAVVPQITSQSDTLICSVPGNFYSWSRNGTVVQSSSSPILPNADNADYQVTVIDTNGCVSTSTVLSFVFNSISTSVAAAPAIWYNHSKLCLEIPAAYLPLELYAADGRLLRKIESDRNTSTSELAPGVYLYRSTNGIPVTGRLLIW